jgi:hypothetical protein
VSAAGNDRRLHRMEGTSGTQLDDWVAAVREIDREQRAAMALARFAQELAGVERLPQEPLRDESPPPRAPQVAAPPPPGRPVWGPDNRPGVHDVLTWEEAMRYFWLMENSPTGNDR